MYSAKASLRSCRKYAPTRLVTQSVLTKAVQQRFIQLGTHSRSYIRDRYSYNTRTASLLAASLLGGGLLYSLNYPNVLQAEAPAPQADIQFEETRREPKSKDDSRNLISSQHLQVQKSWENPGVYAWGSNSGRVVAPDSDELYIKTPRRIAYFDGKILRDIKLDKNFGAAVTENGDLLQWGTKFSSSCRVPTPTLTGKDIIKISLSRDRVIALSSGGTVYSVSASLEGQESGAKPYENTWIPFWKTRSPITYRIIKPDNLRWSESISDIASGLEHCLLLTSKGRVFSCASASEDFPSRGQLGVPGLTWTTRPTGPYDQPHEISTLKGFDVIKIAAGDLHSIVVDRAGRVFAFGDNSAGQLGFDPDPEYPIIDAPSLLSVDQLYRGTNLRPRVTAIYAGGLNSFLTIDATPVAGEGEASSVAPSRITIDTWACGQGILGALGNGKWTHVQGIPTKVKALSGLSEYDEQKNAVVPIGLSHISVGSTHVSAVMSNRSYVGATESSAESDTNWGSDVLLWGGNEFYQLGTGKRNNINNPVYIAPLDPHSEKEYGRGGEYRFQLTPGKKIQVGKRKVFVEQRIECGRGGTVVYSGTY
ncbi:regulator of chromosome condensation 1/beta-lactamase-inhibitor protein II [Xylogone sp. PMI_703]|nr:regulator of chromosome condensation 1/beta-lactamase-inhibitor protein II [Xylogone sp. PMI_703]